MLRNGTECLSDGEDCIRPTGAFHTINLVVCVFCVTRITQADSAKSCHLIPNALRLIGRLRGKRAHATRPRFSNLQPT